ncbi:hypothetical protein SAY86_018151 [Trapa natans]|uniref:Uncharacterized protein n=1 Tax=Trapa natans TaxID=22666 RepID=A0AAN7R2U9_TRANT|nr:hypothetical protein SAY86_018151 [Trapa natans]
MTTRRRVRKRTRKSDEPRKVMSVSAKRKLEQLQRTIPGCSGPLEVDSVPELGRSQHPPPVATHWLSVENHDFRLSEWEAARLRVDLEHRARYALRFRSTVQGTREEFVSGAPMQRLGFSLMDGNLWQVRLRNEDPTGVILAQLDPSGLQSGVFKVDSVVSPEHVQNVMERLVLAMSLGMGLVPGSLVNEIIPWRQSGHGMQPGWPWGEAAVLIEQR